MDWGSRRKSEYGSSRRLKDSKNRLGNTERSGASVTTVRSVDNLQRSTKKSRISWRKRHGPERAVAPGGGAWVCGHRGRWRSVNSARPRGGFKPAGGAAALRVVVALL
jgi:hypothetical protein